MVVLANVNTCVLALVAFVSLFDGSMLDSASGSGSGIRVFVGAAPTPVRRNEGRGNGDQGLVNFGVRSRIARQDDGSTDTLGKLMNDYELLRAAVPATSDGSDLQNALMEGIDQKKEIIFQKFGQIVPGGSALSSTPPATTVGSADGSLMTIYSNPDGSGMIITQDGRNTTVSLGDEQMLSTSTVGPTPTGTTSLNPVSTTATWSAIATTNPASPSPSKHNDASVVRPFDILPTTVTMKSLFTVTGAVVFGAWTAL